MIEVRLNSQYVAIDFLTPAKFWRFALLLSVTVQKSLMITASPENSYQTLLETTSPLFQCPVKSNCTRLEWDLLDQVPLTGSLPTLSEDVLLSFQVAIQLDITTRFRLFLQPHHYHLLGEYLILYDPIA